MTDPRLKLAEEALKQWVPSLLERGLPGAASAATALAQALIEALQELEACRGGTETQSTWAEFVAREFHQTYENLAPAFGYKTREASAVPWSHVPDANRRLMIAVAQDLISRRVIAVPDKE